MRRCKLFALLGLLFFAATGCRRDAALHVYIDEINAEKRILENRLNDMQFELEAKERELQRYRRGGGTTETTPRGRAVPRLELPAPRRRQRDEDDSSMPDLDLTPPMIDPGEKTGDRGRPRNPSITPNTSPASSTLNQTGSPVVELAIDRERTTGVNLDELPGDDGLRVVLRTLDRSGRYQPATSAIDVELYERGNGRSLAAWQFTASEIEVAMSRAGTEHGITLEMRLPREPRTTRQFRLVVRYFRKSDTPVQTETMISLQPNTPKASRWTPRRSEASPRQAAASQPTSAAEPQPLKPDPPGTSPRPLNPQASGSTAQPSWRPYR